MKIKIRRLLFWSFFIFFVVASSYLLLTAQGLVIDFKNLRIVKTGGLFLKFSPTDAEILINNKKPEKVDKGLLQGGLLIKNLPPDDYRVKIWKPGFGPWEKTLPVQSGLITAATQIKIWPEKIQSETVVKEAVQDFWLGKNGLLYQNDRGEIIFGNLVLRGEDVVLAVPESNFLVTAEGENLFLTDLENPKIAINLNQLFNSLKQRDLSLPGTVPVKKVFIHPFSPQKIILTTVTSLYSLDLKKLKLEKLVTLENIDAAGLSVNEAFLVDGQKIAAFNLLLKTTSEYQFEIKNPIKRILVNRNGTKIFIQSANNELYFYNRNQNTLILLEKKLNNFYLSPEEKRVLMVKDKETEIFYLNNYQGDVKYLTGDRAFIPLGDNFAGSIENLSWAPKTLNYVLSLVNRNLLVTELDNRDKINSYTLFNGIEKYILTENNLYLLKTSGELIKTNLNL